MSSKVIKGNVVRDAFVLSPRHNFVSASEKTEQPREDPEVVLQTAREESDRLIRLAEQQAQALLEKARTEVAELKEQAWQEGYQQGHEEGLAVARTEGEEIWAQARQVLAEAEECRKETIEALEYEIIALSREIAEKLVAAQLAVEPETVLQVAKEALQLLYDREQVTIFAHTSEAEIFKEHREDLLNLLPEKASLQVIADPAVEPGCCRVETERGLVDASLDNRWEALLKALYTEG